LKTINGLKIRVLLTIKHDAIIDKNRKIVYIYWATKTQLLVGWLKSHIWGVFLLNSLFTGNAGSSGKREKLFLAAVTSTVLFLAVLFTPSINKVSSEYLLLNRISPAFNSLYVSSCYKGASVSTEYRIADKASKFSGKKPVKQSAKVRNNTAAAALIPVVFTQKIPGAGVFFNGSPMTLPGVSAPALINEKGAQPEITFFAPSGKKILAGKYDWSDVSSLKHEVKVWRENGQGVIQLTVWKRVAAGAEEIIDPVFDQSVTTNFNMRLDGALGGADPANDQFGYSAAMADLNGDGTMDLAVAARFANTASRSNNGAIYIYYGGAANFPAGFGQFKDMAVTANFNMRIDGALTNDKLGYWIDCADLNGDGTADLIIGTIHTTYSSRTYNGSVYVIYGGGTNFSTGTGQTKDLAVATNYNVLFEGALANDYLGGFVSHGNVNGDAYQDLIMAAWYASTQSRTNNGCNYVVYGGPTNFPAGTGLIKDMATASNWNMRFDGASNSDYMGYCTVAGDLNNDATDDLIMASSSANTASTPPSTNLPTGRRFAMR